MDDLNLSVEQKKAAKAVYRAIKNAAKLNVIFWDNYGTLSCYNGDKISSLTMEKKEGDKELEYDDFYYQELDNFEAGNADDPIYVKLY